jgi:hypothetical protein
MTAIIGHRSPAAAPGQAGKKTEAGTLSPKTRFGMANFHDSVGLKAGGSRVGLARVGFVLGGEEALPGQWEMTDDRWSIG